MLRPRVIPCLLVKNGGLVKTVGFARPKYVGDPINAVRIFNEKAVDELFVADIDATALGKEPDYDLIKKLAVECRMPLCYGGGIRNVEQAERLISMGVEKVAVSSAALSDPRLVTSIANVVGGQSVVAVLDVRRDNKGAPLVWTHNGERSTGKLAGDAAKLMADSGAGEIIVNSIDNDGAMQGYDLPLIAEVLAAVSVPVTALGGAGSLAHIRTLIERFGLVGAAAGSLFVFKGVYRAVLINYPSRAEKDALLAASASGTGSTS
jgi:imidazole glycerol-phosphate synthase subunit HisF